MPITRNLWASLSPKQKAGIHRPWEPYLDMVSQLHCAVLGLFGKVDAE